MGRDTLPGEPLRQHLLGRLEDGNNNGSIVDAETIKSSPATDSSFTPLLVFTIIIASCGSLSSGFGVGYSSPVESELTSELSLSTAEFSLFGSLLTAGALLGSITSGKLTDYLGRRGSMGISDILCLAGWFSIAFSQSAWSLYLGRILVGAGVGIISYVIPVYSAEVSPKTIRGGAVLAFMLITSCGTALMFFVGIITSWRVLALIGCVPSVIQIVGLFFIPESPRWLLKMGHDKEYELVLRRLRGFGVDISQEIAEIKESNEMLQNNPEVNFIQLFQKKYAYALTVVLGLMALGQFGGPMAIMYYASSIFESAGFSTTVGSIALSIIQVPVTIVGLFMMDRIGRRPILMISLSGMAIGCFSVALAFLFEDLQWLTKISPYIVFVGIMLFFATYPSGMGGVPFLMMSEIFPMNAKGAAGSLATVINWSTSWVVTYAFNFMLEWSSAGTFLFFACVNACSLIFVTKLVPETKDCSLEEIQESITS